MQSNIVRKGGKEMGRELHLKPLYFPYNTNIKWGMVTICVCCQQGKRNSTLTSFLFQAAKSHPWTPMKTGTMEESNLGSPPCQPAGGAADQGPWPTVLEEARATSLCTAERPPSQWPGTSLREKWAHWLGILEDLWGIGQETSQKDLRKLWKNPPPSLSCMKCTWKRMDVR